MPFRCLIARFCLALNNVTLSGCNVLCPFICWRTSWLLPSCGIWDKAAINICAGFGVDTSFQLILFTKETARLYSKSIFSFMRNRQTVFQGSRTMLHSHQQWMAVPVASQPCQPLMMSGFQSLAVLIGVVVQFLINSSETCGAEHLSMCLSAICRSSSVRFLFRSSAHSSFGLFVFSFVDFKSSLSFG